MSGERLTFPFASRSGDAGDGCTDSEVLPVLARNLSRAQRASEDRHLHLDLVLVAELGLSVDHRKERVVGIAFGTLRQSLCTQRVTLDVEVRVVDRVVLVATCSHLTERTGIDDFATAK